jgi:hypothetical protein
MSVLAGSSAARMLMRCEPGGLFPSNAAVYFDRFVWLLKLADGFRQLNAELASTIEDSRVPNDKKTFHHDLTSSYAAM